MSVHRRSLGVYEDVLNQLKAKGIRFTESRKADHGAAQKSFRRPNPYPPCRRFCFSFSDSYSHHVSGIQPCRRNQR